MMIVRLSGHPLVQDSLRLLPGSGNLLAILLEVPLLSLALFLETSGLVNHQHLMSIVKSLGIVFSIPCIL